MVPILRFCRIENIVVVNCFIGAGGYACTVRAMLYPVGVHENCCLRVDASGRHSLAHKHRGCFRMKSNLFSSIALDGVSDKMDYLN
ncbi:hypothetical protein CEXT_677481 [Caerostris extrusa]|uniref:Uncharacterized protein n=1 Tax=Caerostris extrusa TaxID=172846 RepID=A0AAV4S974_CAEEX|nr:hypothetical protein CEXT_677481 [Caerostris extrusa]